MNLKNDNKTLTFAKIKTMSFFFKNKSFLLIGLLVACKQQINFQLDTPKKITIDKTLNIAVKTKKTTVLDSVLFYLDGQKIKQNNIDISNKKLGKHLISAKGFYNGKSKRINKEIYFLSDKKPVIYSYEIVKTYPHSTDNFTQGMEFYKGFLYESTGQKGKSTLQKIDLKTGKVLQSIKMEKSYFGEGMTIFDGNIFWLTWQGKKGFIYNAKTLKKTGVFSYKKSKEGWGLTHNKTQLLKTDGTECIWFLDPKTQKEIEKIEAYTNKRKVENLNEIEFIDGKIYANIWQKETIVIISPKNGSVEGVVNLKGLSKKVNTTDKSKEFVLNGIAYDRKKKRLFVTGKNWNKIFEINIIKK